MICYLDKAWCSSPNCKNKCGRKFTSKHHELAKLWWGGPNYPLSTSPFCDENGELIDYAENKR